MSVTIEDIEALKRILSELPRHQPKQVSKQEAIALLSGELGSARRRGYSPDELARILSERGVSINAATLRGYLRRNRKSRRGTESNPAIDRRTVAAPTASPASTERDNRAAAPTIAAPPLPPRAPGASMIPTGRAAAGTDGNSAQGTKPAAGSSDGATAQATRK